MLSNRQTAGELRAVTIFKETTCGTTAQAAFTTVNSPTACSGEHRDIDQKVSESCHFNCPPFSTFFVNLVALSLVTKQKWARFEKHIVCSSY